MSIFKNKKVPIFNLSKCLVGRLYVFISIILSFSENWAYSHLSYTLLPRKMIGRMYCQLCLFYDDYRRYESKKDYDSVMVVLVLKGAW